MICVDASLAAKWVLDEEDSEKALSLFGEMRRAGELVVAPHLLPVEVANALWRRSARGVLSAAELDEAVGVFLRFPVQLAAPQGLYEETLRLASRFSRPSICDMVYVALAQLAGCDLWTADQRLVNAVGHDLPFVKALSSFEV